MKSIAIMQPTFLPWIGYFALIDHVDEFIILDHVQFEKRSWQQRNKIKTDKGPIWLSVPVLSKGRQDQSIAETQILYEGEKSPLEKIMRSIEQNYKKATFYRDYANVLEQILSEKPKRIADLNQQLINQLCRVLKIDTPLLKSSEMGVKGSKEALLIDICQKRGATHYISPPGSKNYLEGGPLFQKADIMLSYQEYNHPVYTQLHTDFQPYMCILDLVFNEGPKSTEIIRSGLL